MPCLAFEQFSTELHECAVYVFAYRGWFSTRWEKKFAVKNTLADGFHFYEGQVRWIRTRPNRPRLEDLE